MDVHTFRLTPNQDLKQELVRYATERRLPAAFIMTCVGSLQRVVLRLADQDEATTFEDKFEIVSLVGTLESNGGHIHIAVADSGGKTIGGHLEEGTLVYTTAEVVIGIVPGRSFYREHDPETGHAELKIGKIP